MKIKLAVLEESADYLGHLTAAFHNGFQDKIEVYSFTDQALALEALKTTKIDVFLTGECFEIPEDRIPARCACAYFVESSAAETFREKRAIGKYQRVDLIYKQILGLYAEVAQGTQGGMTDDGDRPMLLTFASPCGGCGSSSAAVACAKRKVRAGARVLFLSLQLFGGVERFFQGGTQGGLSDILYAVKSKKTNLTLKLEGATNFTEDGIAFFAPCDKALDYLELGSAELQRLLDTLMLMGSYDYIIADADFRFDETSLTLMAASDALVLTCDGSEAALSKLARAMESMRILEQQKNLSLLSKIFLLYNRFSSKHGRQYQDAEIAILGGMQRFEGSDENVMEALVRQDLFDRFIRK